jgi:hypothetical protein
MSIKSAHGIAVHACRAGCPVIVFTDENGEAFASVHMAPDGVEKLVEVLRETVAESEALQRPPV